MNSLQRLLASGQGEPLDYPPVVPGIGHYAAYQARQPMTKVAYNPELMAEVVLRSLARHGYDGVSPISDYGLGTESMGSTAVVREWEQTYVAEFAVKERRDIARLRVPDPLRDGRMPVIIDCEQILVEKVGDAVGVSGGVAGPLSFAANLRGTQQLLYDACENPTLLHDLVHIATEACASFGEAQIVHGGVKSINIYEPLCALISPRMADEFSFSYMTDLIRRLKALGVSVLLHICNDTTRIIDRMVDTGADILSLDRQVDLKRAKEIVAGRASISGNVASESLACKCSHEVHAETCAAIESSAAGGRFTVSSACEVPIETPAENIDAMVWAARGFGAQFLRRIEEGLQPTP